MARVFFWTRSTASALLRRSGWHLRGTARVQEEDRRTMGIIWTPQVILTHFRGFAQEQSIIFLQKWRCWFLKMGRTTPLVMEVEKGHLKWLSCSISWSFSGNAINAYLIPCLVKRRSSYIVFNPRVWSVKDLSGTRIPCELWARLICIIW